MSLPFKKLTVKAPAKVNLHLAIKGRRPDGFHELESVFVAVDFGDTLHFEPAAGENATEIVIEGLNFPFPVEKNIIFKALSLFREKTGFNQSLKIRVEKCIPLGGGLGGGSSNAAAALLALNRLAGFPLDRDGLLEMAAALGSDVPFFIYETGAALVTGRGENIRPIEAPRLFFVLVNPGFPSDTAAAFKLLDEYRANKQLIPNFTTQRREDAEEEKKFILKTLRLCLHANDAFARDFGNDFLPVFDEREKSVYNEIISRLRELGADFASLSGAGSTCFGVFKKSKLAQRAAESLHGTWSFVEMTVTLKHSH
jgi:4-diphosphocytidyl-2-C-methyl-D-erythritol kinase